MVDSRGACGALILGLLLLGCIAPATAQGQDRSEPDPSEPIPSSYKSWSLFLICNPQWLRQDQSEEIADLYQSFRAFGDVIGRKHVAVWFWAAHAGRDISTPGQPLDRVSPDLLDIPRMVQLCEKYGLLPSRSPHVLVTTAYPELGAPNGKFSVYEFHDAAPAEIAEVLAQIADALYSHGLPAPRKKRFWVALYDASREVLLGFTARVTLRINAGPFEAELEGG